MASLKINLCIPICFLSILTSAQEMHRITLRIDTKNATPEKALNWTVGDNSHVLNKGKRGSFTVLASVGDHIIWEAISLSDPDVLVRIDHLRYVKGPRIFSRDIIPGGEDIRATVIRGGREDYMYDLIFRIGNSEQEHITSSSIRIIE